MRKEDFTRKIEGHGNEYSCFLIIGKMVDEVYDCLTQIFPCIDAFNAEQRGNDTYFEVWKESPEIVYSITAYLKTVGYADTSWDYTYTVCAKNGDRYDGYTAEWNSVEYNGAVEGDENYKGYNAYVTITDSTGSTFETGGGYVPEGTYEFYKLMVGNHSPKVLIPKDDVPELVGGIIDIFEDFLADKGIEIENSERDSDENLEDGAIIYGDDYDFIADRIRDNLARWKIIGREY